MVYKYALRINIDINIYEVLQPINQPLVLYAM